jgi:ParB family chromosome partitioning protein
MEKEMTRLERIPVAQIDLEDMTFCITFMPDLEPLVSSITLVGLLEPIILRERADNTYQIVCGFKRAEVLRHLALSEVEACVYPYYELDDLQALLLTIGHNLTHPLNLVEKALAIEKLLSLKVPEKEVINRYLPLLGLQPHLRMMRKIINLLKLERGLQEYLVKETLSLSAAAHFLHLDQDGQRAILPLLETLRLGENHVKEIVSFVQEVSLRDGIAVSSLLAGDKIKEIISSQETPRPQRIEQLRKALKRMRFPRLTAMEERFADYKRSLSLPPQLSFYPPPFFEGEEFRMELRFKDFRQLQEQVHILQQIAEKGGKDKDPLLALSRGVDLS